VAAAVRAAGAAAAGERGTTIARGTEVERTSLEMTSRAALRDAAPPAADVRVEHARACPPSFYRYLYAEVGRAWRWTDRAAWTDDEIRAHLCQPGVAVHVLYAAGAPAGYFELTRHGDGSCEISYFGLLPEAMGRGLGKYLLTCAVEAAWDTGTSRVWLHTCTLDGPAALPNYLARGFQPYRRETYFA
jgi:GNAT superfamily N-acetyltransferase